MRQTTLKRTARGFVRKIGPAGGEVKFYLGHDKDRAASKIEAIQAIWSELERRAEASRVKPFWDAPSLEAAKAIARGEVAKIEKRSHESPEKYFSRVSDLRNQGVPVEPASQFLYDAGRNDLANDIATAQSHLASALATPRATGQSLHDALKGYQGYIKAEYREGDHMTDNGKSKLDLVTAMLQYLPNIDLGTLDYKGCDELFGVFRRRPQSKRYKKPMARKSCTNLIGELGRFFAWLHTSTVWAWRRPEDFSYIKRTVREVDEDVEQEAAEVPTWTVEQLAVIAEYAEPLERVFLLLGLNCAYGADQSGRLRIKHLYPNAEQPTHINRVRRKKKVRGIHLLWPQTVEAMIWAMGQRKAQASDSQFLLLTSKSTPFWRKTKGGNQAQDIPNMWKRLITRIRKDKKDFPWLPFNSLRDTSIDLIRQIAGEETASLHGTHKHQSKDENLKRYSNPVRRRHFKALRKMATVLASVFAAAGPEPFKRSGRNIIGLEKVKKIQELFGEGKAIMAIAHEVGVSQGTVYRHLAAEKQA